MSTRRVPLGRFVGARSGDKGGNANVGLWIVDPVERAAVARARGGDDELAAAPSQVSLADARYAWLAALITVEGVRDLLPEAARLEIDVHPLPNLRAVNVVIHGLLGRGVAESSRVDPQAKGLGEHLRARFVDVPLDLLTADEDVS